MTTDTIPEAREATSEIFRRDNSVETDVFSQEHFDSLNDVVEKACLAYHKRKLEECGGDVGEVLKKIRAPLCIDVGKTLELLQLHTTQAVEEAVERATLCPECGGSGTVSEESGLRDVVCPRCSSSWQKKCESLQQALTTAEAVSHGFQEKAGELQKQCAEFQTLWDVLPEIENKYQDRLVIHLREKIEGLQKQCEELRQLSGKGRYCPRCQDWLLDPDPSLGDTCGSCFSPVEYKRIALLQWERFDLRTRVEKLEKAEAEVLSLRLAVADGTTALHDKLQRAEAEVADAEEKRKIFNTVLNRHQGTISLLQDQLTQLQQELNATKAANGVVCQDRNDLRLQLTQLQKDVRPLVEFIKTDGPHPQSKQLLETFLAKHPELKEAK